MRRYLRLRRSGRVWVAVLTALGTISVAAGAAVALGTAPAAAATTAPCNFAVSGGGTAVTTAGGTVIVGAVAGSTEVTISCDTSSGAADAAEASLLAGVGTTAVSQTNEADLSTLTAITASSTATSCPAATAGQCSVGTFKVPASFSATDANAVCPPSAAQVDAGLFGCAVAVVTSSLAPLAGGEFVVEYAGQPTPAAPTIKASLTTGLPGDSITLADATGATGYWWSNAIQQVQAATLGTTPTAAPAKCTGSGGGYGDLPTSFLAMQWVPTSGSPVAGDVSNVAISNDCYNGTTLYAPELGGTTTVPSGLAAGSYTVYLCETNGIPGSGGTPVSNDANVGTDCPTPSVSGTTWIDASFTFTVEGAPTATASPASGGVGTTVTVSGTNFDPSGSTPTVAFTNGTPSPSTGTCAAVTSTGTVSCSISVTSADTQGSNPIVVTQGSLTATATFTVTAISTSCSIDTGSSFTTPTTCSIQQVLSLTVSGNTTIGLTLSEGSAAVTLPALTLNGSNQLVTGSISTVQVNDSRGTLAGWTVTGEFSHDFANATPVGNANDNVIDVSSAGADGQVTVSGVSGFNWVPKVTAVTSRSTEVVAGGTTTTGLSTSSATPLCSAAAGGGGGKTNCSAGVNLTVPAWVAAGTYSATLQLTVS